jgi:DNA polymerase delta subunit 2
MVGTIDVAPLERLSSEVEDVVNPFLIDAKNRSYKHQYSNIYFTRLHQLKPHVQQAAEAKWKDIAGMSISLPG